MSDKGPLGRRPRVWYAVAALGGAGLLLLTRMPAALSRPLILRAFDFGHIPLFAVLAIGLRAACPPSWRYRGAVALVASAVIAGSVEVIQAFIPTRESSLQDFGLGALGATLGLTGVWCWSRRGKWRLLHGLMLLVICGWVSGVLISYARVLAAFDRDMPVLGDFEHDWQLQRWHPHEDTLIGRSQDFRARGQWSLAIRGRRGREFGVSLEGFPPDWRPYRRLTWAAFVPSAAGTTRLTVRIDDDLGQVYGARFSTVIPLRDGSARYAIAFADMQVALPAHPMNLEMITEVQFLVTSSADAPLLAIDDVRLEP